MRKLLILLALCLALPAGAQLLLSDPPVLVSSGHELNVLMTAEPLKIQLGDTHPTAWVYKVCLRKFAIGDSCPVGAKTFAPYGGVRLALEAGDHLKIRFVNHLPPAPPDAEHVHDPMGDMLVSNPTNLHTHGLIVEPRRATASDPTYGDYVYVLAYPKGKLPAMQHPGLDYTDKPVDYDIYIPKNHPSGLFWFHPHAHGLALNQVSEGMAGIITIGSPEDYLADENRRSLNGRYRERYLTLKDMQVLAGNEVLDQEDPDFCNPDPAPKENRNGFCVGTTDGHPGGKWFFSINGQVFPTINVDYGSGEVWRITNASGSRAYELALLDDKTGSPLPLQVLALDGVSLESDGVVPARLKGRIKTRRCGSGQCATSIEMFPSSRVELWVSSRQAEKVSSATLITSTVVTGDDADHWPAAKLAKVTFKNKKNATVIDRLQVSKSGMLDSTGVLGSQPLLSVNGQEMSLAQLLNSEDMTAKQRVASLNSAWATNTTPCKALRTGHRRRIFFGVPAADPDAFGLGYEEVDHNGEPVPGSFQPVEPFDHARINICLPLADGNRPVEEDWELINVASEDHNFHIHQTKFRVTDPGSNDPVGKALVDNVPVPHGGSGCDGSVESWRTGACQVDSLRVRIPFSQVGDFVYHCHILEHEDGGMMAHIRVIPNK